MPSRCSRSRWTRTAVWGWGTGLGGRLIVVGAEPGDVARIADASVRTFLTVTLGG